MNRLALIVLRNLCRLPGACWKLSRYARHPERYPEAQRWAHVQKIMRWVADTGNVDLQVYGKENIPQDGSFMLYANHQGMFDVVALAATCDRPLGAVYKKELQNVPVLKQILQSTLSYAMDREDVRQSLTVIRNVTEEVLSGRNYLIFPEGTRSKNGNAMGEFHSGSFRAATKAQCPIIPVAFINSFRVLDRKGSAPVTVKMYYLEPITYEQYASLKTVELADLVKQRIAQAIEAGLS